eukprot:TRINITY_DN6050_c4_g1_i1.p1 TRINITY_DN6050_c4_g1~~TRINITY_DN6050_c4_g1_i1.p1  ORF type:complete len:314 (+),score=89.21 TRINITY_DN6050_c4_g1_i1:61-1002(+)
MTITHHGDKYIWDGSMLAKEYGSFLDKFTFDGSTWRPDNGMNQGRWDGSTMWPSPGDHDYAVDCRGGDFYTRGGGADWRTCGSNLRSPDGTLWYVEGGVPEAVVAGFIFSVGNKGLTFESKAAEPEEEGRLRCAYSDEEDEPAEPSGGNVFTMETIARDLAANEKPVPLLDDWGTPNGEVKLPLLCDKHPYVFFKPPPEKQRHHKCDTCNEPCNDVVYHCKVCDDRKRHNYICKACAKILSEPQTVKAHKHPVYIMKEPFRSNRFVDRKTCDACGKKGNGGGAMCTDPECKKWVCINCVKSPLGIDPCGCIVA